MFDSDAPMDQLLEAPAPQAAGAGVVVDEAAAKEAAPEKTRKTKPKLHHRAYRYRIVETRAQAAAFAKVAG